MELIFTKVPIPSLKKEKGLLLLKFKLRYATNMRSLLNLSIRRLWWSILRHQAAWEAKPRRVAL
jgi:hypothetical protein